MKRMLFGLLVGMSMSVSASLSEDKFLAGVATSLKDITGFNVKSISKHKTGLIQLVTEQGVFYTTPDGKHLINGQVHVLEDGLYNLTAETKRKIATSDIETIKDTFVSYKAAEEKHELVVFFDTTCGYCKRMHSQMSQYNARGITIHYAIWPRQGIFVPGSRDQVNTQGFLNMQSIVCAPNPEMAMDMVMRDTPIPKSSCDNKIEESYKLGNLLGVKGTPAVYDMNGEIVSRGYLPPAALQQKLGG